MEKIMREITQAEANSNVMGEYPPSRGKYRDVPSRDLAKERLQKIVADKRRELAGLEELLKVADKCEDGSPLEEVLHRMLCNQRNYL